jgi:serine/threonine protein phosphatase PrpC
MPKELIRTMLNAPNNPSEVADDLIESALHHGGKDNVTVMAINTGK